MNMELRNDGSLEISGYVNAVDRYSKELYGQNGKFIEKVEPQTFQRALEKAENVDMLLNHDTRRKLADTVSGTLELREDSIGLYAKATINDPEVIAEANKGNLKGWSFGFKDNNIQVEECEGLQRRTLSDIDLMEVSLLTIEPAYIATSVQVRSEELERRTNEDVVEVQEPEEEQRSIVDDFDQQKSDYEKSLLKIYVWLLRNK